MALNSLLEYASFLLFDAKTGGSQCIFSEWFSRNAINYSTGKVLLSISVLGAVGWIVTSAEDAGTKKKSPGSKLICPQEAAPEATVMMANLPSLPADIDEES